MAYSPEMVMLLQQLRSRIQAEFGVKIRLVDPELLTTLGDMGKKSRDPFIRKTVAEVMGLAGIHYSLREESKPQPPAHDEEGMTTTEITYRGRKIYKHANGHAPVMQVPETIVPKSSKQMYRGQIVSK